MTMTNYLTLIYPTKTIFSHFHISYSYFYEFTPTDTPAGSTPSYIANHENNF